AELLPLYARLSAPDQDRVFRPGRERRIVLATNVAETSLTVPRIRYVVDTGLARVKRYSYRNKVEMLRVEPISRAAANQRAEGCLEQLLIIAAALSVQDPRERPLERATAADERHAKFADERSDFLAFLKLRKLFDGKLEKACRENFLSVPRMREWRDIHAQLETTLGEMKWPASSANPESAEGYRAIHRALLAGLLGNVGMRDEAQGSYTSSRRI